MVDMTPKERFLSTLDPDWELVGEYVNAKTMTEFRHKPCGVIVKKTPMVLKQRPKGCRFCNAKKLTMTHQQFIDKVRKTFPKKFDDYELLSEYAGASKTILVKHKVCGNTYRQLPTVFSRCREGCPYCKNTLISNSHLWDNDKFVSAMGWRAKEYVVVSEYTGSHDKIILRHCCGQEFSVTPSSFLRGSGCPRCKASTVESEVYDYVSSICRDAKQGVRNLLPKNREVDIYCPSHKVGFEIDGLRYHTVEHFMNDKHRDWSFSFASKYHLWKTDECYKKGVRLIHIYEDEWRAHRDIVEDKIRATLKIPMERIYARNTTAVVLDNNIAREFLSNNHIQGASKSQEYIGLSQDDRLVAVIAFSELRKGLGGADGDWELQRYATLLGVQVVGGFSKCLKTFERLHCPALVVSYGDLRWIDREKNVYLSNGFRQTIISQPSFDYVKGLKRTHRFSMRKSVIRQKFPEIYDASKTEKQMASELGYQRIYDCGKIRYEKTFCCSEHGS